MSEKCCPNCTDELKCTAKLDELSEAVGYDVWDNCECECETNTKKIEIRQGIHSNPDVDTSKAEVNGYGEVND